MRLRGKSIILHGSISLAILLTISFFLQNSLTASLRGSLREDISGQLAHLDFYLTDFIDGIGYDLDAIIGHPVVRARNEGDFTSFLNADPKTFQYHYGQTELDIIAIFNNYRLTHQIVSSVYMGRENGASVRSHPRSEPTAYDPRQRPWYQLAKKNPGKIVHTDPYPSVTTKDINLGVVKALVDGNGQVFGAVGIDVTLSKLTDYLSQIRFNPEGRLMVVDGAGTILTSENKDLLFTALADYSKGLSEIIKKTNGPANSVIINGKEVHVITRSIGSLGWTALVLIPEEAIQVTIQKPILVVLITLAVGMILLTLMVILGLNKMVIRPIKKFSSFAAQIAQTGELDQRLTLFRKDELGELSTSWNEMLDSLAQARDELQFTESELRTHRDHLETLVAERTESLIEAKDKAEAADRLKSSFLATMSHELRTPLNSIIGFTGIILKGLVGPLNEEQTKQLGMVKGSANHLLALINDILDISKIEAGQFIVQDQPFDLTMVIDKAVLGAQPLAEKKNLKLERIIEVDLPPIRGDARRVEQVLLNFISNAIKFTEKGTVTVTCCKDGESIRIDVHDTGIGIKEEHLATLFQDFRQIDTGLTRQYEGTGLGLSISKRLVKLMGGDISVKSLWGQGSTFSFTLPLRS